jgi:hypothetical protein
MTLDQLINRIAKGGNVSASVRSVLHGNEGGKGDYRIVTLKIDENEFVFTETETGWLDEATDLVNRLMSFHNAVKGQAKFSEDWALARSLEDSLGSGQFIHSQIQRARSLLARHSR